MSEKEEKSVIGSMMPDYKAKLKSAIPTRDFDADKLMRYLTECQEQRDGLLSRNEFLEKWNVRLQEQVKALKMRTSRDDRVELTGLPLEVWIALSHENKGSEKVAVHANQVADAFNAHRVNTGGTPIKVNTIYRRLFELEQSGYAKRMIEKRPIYRELWIAVQKDKRQTELTSTDLVLEGGQLYRKVK